MPVRAADRRPERPARRAPAGTAPTTPSRIADFIDFVVLGDGEEVVSRDHRGGARLEDQRSAGERSREEVLRALAQIPGVYVPSMYDVQYYDGADLVAVTPSTPTCPPRSRSAPSPTWPTGPTRRTSSCRSPRWCTIASTSRCSAGCTRGCRFCQAGMITRPVRERPLDQVRTMVDDGLRRTGYDEVALTSLSTADFSGIEPLVRDIIADPVNGQSTNVSLPSLAGRCVHRRHRERAAEGPAHRAHVRARGRLAGACAR